MIVTLWRPHQVSQYHLPIGFSVLLPNFQHLWIPQSRFIPISGPMWSSHWSERCHRDPVTFAELNQLFLIPARIHLNLIVDRFDLGNVQYSFGLFTVEVGQPYAAYLTGPDQFFHRFPRFDIIHLGEQRVSIGIFGLHVRVFVSLKFQSHWRVHQIQVYVLEIEHIERPLKRFGHVVRVVKCVP